MKKGDNIYVYYSGSLQHCLPILDIIYDDILVRFLIEFPNGTEVFLNMIEGKFHDQWQEVSFYTYLKETEELKDEWRVRNIRSLEVGQEIWKMKGDKLEKELKIVRVTKTQAIANDGTRFKRERGWYGLDMIGQKPYDRSFFRIPSMKYKNDLKLAEERNKLVDHAHFVYEHIHTRRFNYSLKQVEKINKELQKIIDKY